MEEVDNICKEESGGVVSSEENKTPGRPPRASKRKCVSPVTPQGRITPEGDVVLPSAKRRKKSTSGVPHSPLLKPPLTERQQMAILMQMTDPQKQASLSGGEDSVSTTPKSEPSLTPRSRLQKRNERGETMLHTACIKGDVKLVTSLIDQGADINTTDNAGWTPLHEACNHGHFKVVSLLLKHRADVNARGMDGDTPLHDAAVNGHQETVQLLLKYGSDPYQLNDKDQNPIDACKNPDIVSLMRDWPHRGVQEDSDDEDVFAASKETRPQSRTSQLRRGSKGSSRSSAGDDSDSSLVKGSLLHRNSRGRPRKVSGSDLSRGAGHTPTSRPRGVLYSDLSSSGSENEGEKMEKTPRLRGRKGKYNFAKMAETKQKLLGKLDESKEADEKRKKKEEEEEVRKTNEDGNKMEEKDRSDEVHRVEEKETISEDEKEEVEEGEVVDSEEEGEETEEKREELGGKEEELGSEGEEEGQDDGEDGEGVISREVEEEEEESPMASHDEAEADGSAEQISPTDSDSPDTEDMKDGIPSLQQPPTSPDDSPPTIITPLPPSPLSPGEPSLSDQEQLSAKRESSVEKNESQEVEDFGDGNSGGSGTEDGHEDEKVEDKLVEEESPSKSITSPSLKVDEVEDRNMKEEYVSTSESEQEADAMDVEPAEALSASHGSSASASTPDQEEPGSLLLAPSTCQSVTRRSKDREAKMATNHNSSSEDSEVVFDRVLRSAAKKNNTSSTPGTQDRMGERFVVSLNLKMLMRPIKSEDSRMSCSLPRLDMDAARALGPRYFGDKQDFLGSNSYDSPHFSPSMRDGSGMDHVLAKHRAMAQPQTPLSRRLAEEREGKARRDSLSVSFDWSSLPSSHGSTQSAPCSTVGSPLMLNTHQDSANDDDNDGDEKKEEQAASTLVSLPLAFSDSADNAESSLLGFPANASVKDENEEGEGAETLTSTPGPTHHRLRGQGPGSDGRKQAAGMRSTPTKRERGGVSSQHQEKMDLLLSLPPKRRFRPLIKSSVIQQRLKSKCDSIPWPAHLSSFLMHTRQYRSDKKLQPADPKLVYPPLVPSLYKLFTEQESDRVQLATAHLTQQDRIVLSMEQELLRAHQRATRDYIPVSVCTFLLEKLQNQGLTCRGLSGTTCRGLLGGYALFDDYSTTEHNEGVSSSPPHEDGEPVDIRLLSGLVQDVWDKFQELYFNLQARQRHETETLWAVQHSQWKQKIKELGLSPTFCDDLPNSHVPLAAATVA